MSLSLHYSPYFVYCTKLPVITSVKMSFSLMHVVAVCFWQFYGAKTKE